MKITYITHESFLDHSFTIINDLKKHADLKVFILAKKLNDELENWCNVTGAEFIKRLRFRNPTSFITEIQNLKKLKATNADKFWFNTLTAYQTLLLKKFINNELVMMHDVEFHPGITDKYAKYAHRSTLKKFNKKICTASYNQAELFRKKYGRMPMVFQLPIIDYYTSFAGNENLYNERQINELKSKVRFFFFGTIEKYKGLDTIIDAVRILNQKGLNFEVNVYGKIKKGNEKLGERINEINNVNLFNNYIDFKEIYKIYRENDILILPYNQITQCGPLLIGYNQNMPVICSDLPGFREYVDEGSSGLFFNNSFEDLADKMENVINDTSLIIKMRNYISGDIKNKFGMHSLNGIYLDNLK